MRYFVIGDEDTVLGFQLAGVEGKVAGNPEEAERVFDEVLDNHDFGIVLITERVAELIRDRVDRFIFTQAFPLILEIPDRNGRLEGKPDLRQMVNRAIGINL
ncbi:MAG: V-type ATP synthase subunit F [Spirochaetales bacterium]|nr:V-type ATP synthase subunit F [Spirochaetales bacterium]